MKITAAQIRKIIKEEIKLAQSTRVRRRLAEDVLGYGNTAEKLPHEIVNIKNQMLQGGTLEDNAIFDAYYVALKNYYSN